MARGKLRRVRRWLEESFPERQLLLRSQGQVRYLNLSRNLQITVSATAIVVMLWLAVGSVGWVLSGISVTHRDDRIADLLAANHDLTQQIEDLQARYSVATSDLKTKHDQIAAIFNQRNALEKKLVTLRKELATLASRFENSQSKGAKLQSRIDGLERKLAATQRTGAELRSELAASGEQRTQVKAERDRAKADIASLSDQQNRLEAKLAKEKKTNKLLYAELGRVKRKLSKARTSHSESSQRAKELDQQVTALSGQLEKTRHSERKLTADLTDTRTQLAKTASDLNGLRQDNDILNQKVSNLEVLLAGSQGDRSQVEENLAATQVQLETVTRQRNRAQDAERSLTARVGDLDKRIEFLQTAQAELVERIRDRTEINIADLERTIATTGIDVDELVSKAMNQPGLGGPVNGYADLALGNLADRDQSGQFEQQVTRLETHLARWAGLQQVLRRLPLTRPVDIGYVSSGFGKRRDPFSKRYAMHYGVDYSATRNTPIYSTAPGKVVYAGRKGPYGRMVEIDHGHGVRTRYGHMRKILVKRGQSLDFRHKIGLMGNTGRSTGTHVHYEILYNGVPQNPEGFIKAGQNVFKK